MMEHKRRNQDETHREPESSASVKRISRLAKPATVDGLIDSGRPVLTLKHSGITPTIQASLAVSQPGDRFEHEADEVARRVVDGHASQIHETGGTIDRAGEGIADTTPEFQAKLQSSKGSGQPVDASTRREMESSMGADFSGVRIHLGTEAHNLNEMVNAKAFTHGQNVYFRHGEYNPESKQGQKLLAHELVHTQQQRNHETAAATKIQRQVIEDRTNNPDVKKVYKQYKTLPYSVDTYLKDWHIYLQERPHIKQAFEEEGTRVGIAPSELFTIAMGEGLGFVFDEGVDEKSKISGFGRLGTDHFSSGFNKYKKYLPADYNRGDEFEEEIDKNEKGQIVKSAAFKNLRVGLTAFAAVYKFHRQLAINYGNDLGYPQPTPDQLHFWSYYFFQMPYGEKPWHAMPALKKAGSWDFTKMKFDKTSSHPSYTSDFPSLCYKRVATWRYIKSKGIFSS
jgi:hypothetical protein